MKTDHDALQELMRIDDETQAQGFTGIQGSYDSHRFRAAQIQWVIRAHHWEELALRRLERALSAAQDVGD